MNRKELVDAISSKTGASKKDAEQFVSAFMEVVTDELKRGGQVSLVGFGTFKVASRAAREARNPQTGERISIPARKVPQFKPSKNLKDAL